MTDTIITMSKRQVKDELIIVLGAAYRNCGYRNIDGKAMIDQTDDLYNLLLKYYPNITIDEIKDAVERGSLKEYGDFAGLSNSNIFSFIRSYRAAATKNLVNVQTVDEEPEHKAMPKVSWDDMIRASFKTYKESGLIVLPPDMIYGYFVGLGLPIEDPNTLHEEAKQRIVAEKQKEEKRSEFNAGMVMGFLRDLGRSAAVKPSDESQEDTERRQKAMKEVERMAMKVAVQHQFDSLIEKKQDIEQFLNTRKHEEIRF